MEILIRVYVALLGLSLGSFLGMAATRLPVGESLVKPRSHCRNCGRQLAWYENVPAFSYLILRGRCRSCDAKISSHYFILEVATAALALFAFSRLEPWPRFLIYLLLFIAPVLLLIVIDWRYLILPNAITVPGIAAGFLVHWLDGKYFSIGTMHASSLSLLLESGYGAAAGGLSLALLAYLYQSLRKRPGLGAGDVKFAAMLGAFFGWKAIFFIFFAASILGIVVGGILIVFRRQTLATQLPFGSALGVVSLLFLFMGERMIQAYFHALRHLL